ncbi:hypothetical protein [Streptomyces sp. NPDC004658]|uniref:hypothetical protein n=1 Tax=Streptomyces sp. NPDC004658 TaxID=3154672 RepID=UPI0033ACDCA4
MPETVGPLDAEAVRSALEEFEDAVERARRDSDTGSFARPVSIGTAPQESGTATRPDDVTTASHRARPDSTGAVTRSSHPDAAPPRADDTPAADPPPHPAPTHPTPADTTTPTPPTTPPHDPNHLPEGAEQ